MKAISCEMCGDNLIKKGDVYECQSCGTKYTAEEAKKLLVEIDNTDRVKRLYKLARTARDDNNIVDAQKYYDEIKVECPEDWEAAFFSLYFRLCQSKVFQIVTVAKTMQNSLNTIFQLTSAISDKQERVTAVQIISIYTRTLADSLYKTALDHVNEFFSTTNSSSANTLHEFGDRAIASAELLHTLSTYMTAFESMDNKQKIRKYIIDNEKRAIEIIVNMVPLAPNAQEAANNLTNNYKTNILKYEPNYTQPSANTSIYSEEIRKFINFSKNTSRSSSGGGGGCYIATSVYGSYDCPQVWTLRRYRDNTLSNTWYGRAFIHTYYAISPTIVKYFGNTQVFQHFWKKRLDKWVRNLNNNGLENTPYQDKKW